MSHFKKVCDQCGVVLGQCRCPSKDKMILYGRCAQCAAARDVKKLVSRIELVERKTNKVVKTFVVDSADKHVVEKHVRWLAAQEEWMKSQGSLEDYAVRAVGEASDG